MECQRIWNVHIDTDTFLNTSEQFAYTIVEYNTHIESEIFQRDWLRG